MFLLSGIHVLIVQYLYLINGVMLRPLTKEEYMISALVGFGIIIWHDITKIIWNLTKPMLHKCWDECHRERKGVIE